MDNREPIFIFITRSFWLTVAGITTLFGAGQEVLDGVAFIAAAIIGWDAGYVSEVLQKAAPVVLWLAAMQQRSGASRPYSLLPASSKELK